jgi:hypothetical protein
MALLGGIPGATGKHFYNTQKLPITELEEVMERLLAKPPKHRTTPGNR